MKSDFDTDTSHVLFPWGVLPIITECWPFSLSPLTGDCLVLGDLKPVWVVRQDFLSLSLCALAVAALLRDVCSPVVGVETLRVELYQALTPLDASPWWGRFLKEVRPMWSQRNYASPV